MGKKGVRLDTHLASEQLSASREKAKREIIAGWVKVNGETIRQPSKIISGDERITVKRPGGIFVSRGGDKLNHALKSFDISVSGYNAADLGASTGGFTDCILKAGANHVYAIDVGYGQLDYSLRNDPRVFVMEKTNVRYLEKQDFNHIIDFITIDLSFISISKIIPTLNKVFAPVSGIILIKPQFEAMPSEHKKGVVRKIEAHKEILRRVLFEAINEGIIIRDLTFSPLKGPAGNIEFLLYFGLSLEKNSNEVIKNLPELISNTVDEAHTVLNK